MVTINYYQSLPETIAREKQLGLAAYESRYGVDVNYHPGSIVLMDEHETIGVLEYYTAYAEIYIDDVWVSESYRGQGFGTQLIALLEQKYQHEGFNNINLVTSEFQAPEFYRKCGFIQEHVRINKQHAKFNKYYFVKFFQNPQQTQGLI